MKILLLLCFIAYGYAVDDCAKGQAHWCTDLRQAKQCNAVQHCIDNVWSQQAPYKADNGDVCKFCKNIIGDVRKLLNNKTEEKIAQYLTAACGLCPAADKCRSYIDNDLNELFTCIRSKLDPGAVCSTIKLCASYQDFTHQPEPIHRVPLLKSRQDVHLADMDSRMAERTGNRMYGRMVGRMAVPMYGRMAGHMGGPMYERMAAMMKVETKKTMAATTRAVPDVCVDCERIFHDFKIIVTDKNTEVQLEKLLQANICVLLGPASDECQQMVKDYLPELLQLVADQVEPKVFCQVIGLCLGGDRSLLARMRLEKSPLFKSASQLTGTDECDGCKVIMSTLQELDRNNVVQKDLEDLLKTKLCPALGALQKDCLTTVDAYGQFLFEFLANELDPDTRCESLGFCVASNTIKVVPNSSPMRLVTPVSKTVKTLKQSVQCVICEFVISKLDTLLENNRTENKIIDALDKVCKILPDTVKEECDKFILEYGPAVIDLLLQEVSPQVLCTSLGLCFPGSNTAHKLAVIRKHAVLKSTTSCGVCQMVINYMDAALEENATEAQIKTMLDKVCEMLPIGKECDEFVQQYTPQIIQLLVQLADPKKICIELGLCPKKVVKATLIERIAKPLLVGVSKCSYGPAYWCSKTATAKECNAVAYCQRHGWVKS